MKRPIIKYEKLLFARSQFGVDEWARDRNNTGALYVGRYTFIDMNIDSFAGILRYTSIYEAKIKKIAVRLT